MTVPLLAAVRAEVLKLRKRPASLVLAGLLVAAVLLLGYVLNYTVIGADLPHVDEDEILRGLLPALVVPMILSQLAQVGGPIALILAALAVGAEYRWGTVKNLATQGPGRVTLAVGKLVAIALAVAVLAAAALTTGGAASLVVAGLQGEPLALPPPGELAAGLGLAWLMLAVFAALGAVLAFAFRSTAVAIGLGLVYFFVIEVALVLPQRILEVVEPVLLGPNVIALSTAFGLSPVAPFAVFGELPPAGQAAAVLAAYVVGFSAIGVLVFRRRPIS